MRDWTIAVLPLLGVLLGVVLQFCLSRAAERERRTEELRSQLYAEYLRAVAASGHLRSDEDLRDAHRDLASAKARIAVYGSPSVIKALAQFEEVGTNLTADTSATAFVSLVLKMRDGRGIVPERELRLVLLGAEQRDAPDDAHPRG